MKLPAYGLSFCLLAAAATLTTVAFLPDAFGSALAQQAQSMVAPADAGPISTAPSYAQSVTVPVIVLQRNPFISDNGSLLAPGDSSVASNPQAFAPESGAASIPGAPGTQQGQASGDQSAQPQPAQDGLLGVVVGARSYALVSDHGSTRIVEAGDSFEGRTIARVTGEGIRFTDGSHAGIPLPE
jgi:hypothetical protein